MTTYSVLNVTSDVNVDFLFDTYIINADKSNIRITLPNIICDGNYFAFKRRDSTNNVVTLVGYTENATIDDEKDLIIYPWDKVAVVSSENVWYTI